MVGTPTWPVLLLLEKEPEPKAPLEIMLKTDIRVLAKKMAQEK